MTLSGTGLLNCKCLNTIRQFIHPRYRQQEVINYDCENVEVIITLTTGISVCVDPSQPWVQRIINKKISEREQK
ncbi:hypothetical protein XENTR_v10001016 [Xenopus tropicalis]|nr:hypothetical protein XENTR_v10001016 [Xenopus tropicalis]KAE8630914.1 hypothetical protein XENTR_v10001016 [Xenopus tropicalis]